MKTKKGVMKMKRISLLCGFAVLAASLSAVTVSDVTVRQDWPWSSRIEVSYRLAGVTRATNILVELYDGTTKIGTAVPEGEWLALGADGAYALSFDLKDVSCEGHKLAIGNFKVKLVPQAAHPSWDFPLYKDIDLETGGVTNITPAQIVSGSLGTWKWADETATKISDSGAVAYSNLVWTGVAAEGSKYKTSHLVLRYLAAKGDKAYICNSVLITLPQDLYFAVFETTQAQWTKVYGSAPSCNWTGDALPVEKVKYDNIRGAKGPEGNEAQYFWPNNPDPNSFLGKLRSKCGLSTLDLPASYEWTYAVMAKSMFCSGSVPPPGWNDNVPWDDRTVPPGRRSQTGEVGLYADPSMQGLYDMHGNVAEFCLDYMFTSQLEFKNLKTTVNVNPNAPTQNAAGTECTSRAFMGATYSTTKSDSSLNYLVSSKGQAPSSTSSTVGFRVCMPAAITAQEVVPLDDATSGESASVFVYVKPQESFLWSTAPAGEFAVTWAFPKDVSSATLAVTGMVGYSETYANLTGTSQELTLPAASKYDENVYELTLTFADGSQKTARLARVYGDAVGDTAVARYVPPTNKRWNYALDKNVLPIPFGAGTLTVDGTPVETGLAGAAGWYGLGLSAAEGAKSVSLTVDDVTYENELVLPNGLMLLIH